MVSAAAYTVYSHCDDCDEMADTITCDDMYYCEDCAVENGYEPCARCGEWGEEEDRRETDGVCRDCVGPFEFYLSANGPSNMTWNEWAKFADLAGEIDFGCNFDDDGYCERGRHWLSKGQPGYRCQSCCECCASNKGYLQRLPVEAIEPVTVIFDEETGFHGPNGCRLPGKWRSSICFGHKCGYTYSADNFGELAWSAYKALMYHGINHDENITIEAVREKMQKAGLLKSQRLT